MSAQLGDDVGFAAAPLGEVRENLFVVELDVLEIQLRLDVGIEQLQKILEELMQEFLEALIVTHFASPFNKEKTKKVGGNLPVPVSFFRAADRCSMLRSAPKCVSSPAPR